MQSFNNVPRRRVPLNQPGQLWAYLAAGGLALSAVVLLLAAFWPGQWQAQALRDILLLGYAVPALAALGSWRASLRQTQQGAAAGPYDDAQYLLMVFWTVAAGAIAIAHGWAGTPWVTGNVHAGFSLVVGTGALAPVAAAALAPQALRRHS
ncbi:MAG: hypothetical protein EOO40_06330 [Deltaproteobacteria bacterium]|jgi:hypothetical protein|nr:MAG: hypothetical protein EOO40_06330 [Deltaproteobacteria bacterium]